MKRLLLLLICLLSISVSAQIPDTVYSKTVVSNVKLNGSPFENAEITYTLVDSTNGNYVLIRTALTNNLGQDIVDSLPVIKNFVGINPLSDELADTWIYISNNGLGSDHLIRFKIDAKSVSKEAYITNLLGQQITKLKLQYNSITKTYDAVWHGEHEKKGLYIFHTKTSKGIVASKILHQENAPSAINYDAGKDKNNEDGKKSLKADEDAASKYAIRITHEGLEELLDTVLVKENNFHNFLFNVNGIQYDDANVQGQIYFTEGGDSPSDANVEYKRFFNQSQTYTTTAPDGEYEIDVPVVYEQQNPGQTKYIVTLTENGDPFITELDTVLVSPGANGFIHYVIQNIQQSDTVYSEMVTSNVLLDGTAFQGANISYTLLDSITGNQELIREAITNAAGQDIVDSLPVLRAETGLGASKYIINVTHENLESLIDTVLVQEDTFHEFFFNVTGAGYDDADIWGQIYFTEGGQSPSDANVEYKRLLNQSEIYTTTAPNGVYNIQVPVVFEAPHPGQTEYIVTLTENGDPFITEIDTVLVSLGSNGFTHYVEQTVQGQEQDIEGIVRNVYSKNLESGVTVRVINRTTGELIEEDITGSDGVYSFLDIPAGTLVEFELGKTNELWMVNNEHDVPAVDPDTVVNFNRYFYPKTVEVPQVGTNTTIEGDGEEIAELTGQDYINFEEILRDIDNMWANGPGSDYWSARTWIENNFYEGNSPITTVSTERDITNTMQTNYEPYTNFYAGELGWNVNFNSGNLTIPLNATTTYGVYAIIGGEIMTTSGGDIAPLLKEMEGRRLFLGPVNSRLSFMNSDPAMPDNKDRAYTHVILINQDGRFDTDQETYSLENITSTEPVGYRGDMGNKEKVGNKPHSKMHFNWQKFEEQMRIKNIPVISTKQQ